MSTEAISLTQTSRVSRAEFLTMAMAATGLEPLEDVTLTGFYDDEAIPTWAKGYVSSALKAGAIQGSLDQEGQPVFGSGETVTRGEATVMLDNLMGILDVPAEVFASESGRPLAGQAAGQPVRLRRYPRRGRQRPGHGRPADPGRRGRAAGRRDGRDGRSGRQHLVQLVLMRRSETAPLLRQNLRLSRRFCLSEASFVWDVPSQTHVPGKNKIPDNPRWRAFYSRCVGDFPCGHFPVLLPKAMTRSPSLQEIRGRPRLDCAGGAPSAPAGASLPERRTASAPAAAD